MSDRDLHADVARGIRAEQELRETEAAFDALEAAILKKLVETSPSNEALILKLHFSAQTLHSVREALQRTVANGKHADHAMAAREALAATGLNRP